jgi:regulator of protease activity HflC (stomatin/prohibitin superfamily)
MNYIKLSIVGFISLVILITIFSTFGTVPAGNVGILTQFGKVIGTIQPGFYTKIPWGIQRVNKMNTWVRKDDVKAEAGSKDLQIVNTDIVVNYHISAPKAGEIFQGIGDNEAVKTNIVAPAVSEVVKASVALRTAEEVLTKRTELKSDIDAKLSERLANYNVIVDDVSIVNVDFSPEFNKAIEAKQVAEQQAQQAKFVADKAIRDAEAIVNNAKGQAEAQRLVQQSLTPELLMKMAIEKWKGDMPTYWGGGALPFINIVK